MSGARTSDRELESIDDELSIHRQLAKTLVETGRRITRELDNRLEPYGVGHGILPVLFVLWNKQGLTQREIAEYVGVDSTTLVRTIDRMETQKLVRRERQKNDRRKIRVYLNAKGEKLQSKILPVSEKFSEMLVDGLSEAEEAALIRAHRHILKNLLSQTAGNTD